MRKFLVSVAIIGLVAAFPPAFAQDREHQDKGGPPHGEQHGGPQGGGAPHGAPPGPPPGPRPAAQAQPERGGPPRGGEMRGPREERPARNDAMRGPEQRPAANNAMRGPERGPAPNTAMRPNPAPENRPANAMRGFQGRRGPNNARRGPSRDFSSVRNFHQNFRAERRFHAAAYARPRGFYEHRWTWGETLPPFFWARQYWILDFMDYDLPPPPYGAVWVRVNDDAVLIDQYSGMIIEVDYRVFY